MWLAMLGLALGGFALLWAMLEVVHRYGGGNP
jgi:hypothetical protein